SSTPLYFLYLFFFFLIFTPWMPLLLGLQVQLLLLVVGLDEGNVGLIEKYQSDLLADGIRLSSWAERLLWELKLIGKEVDRYFYDTALAICASQGESAAVLRLLTTLEASSSDTTCRDFESANFLQRCAARWTVQAVFSPSLFDYGRRENGRCILQRTEQ
ncbi:hypothetical protein Dimus_020507, partial [Dionaea muscipula]